MATWTYSEYANGACTNYADHHNYTNVCSVSYANYTNQSYRNHGNSGTATYHHNYVNQGHKNYVNYLNGCTNYGNHHNHTNYSLSDKGTAKVLVWSSPWGGVSGARTLNETYITDSVDAIKQLRDNIGGNQAAASAVALTDKLSYNTTVASLDEIPDSEFGTDALVLPPQNNDLKSNLDDLWATIRGDDDASVPGTDTKVRSNDIDKVDMELLASKADQLASYADPSYGNHIDYANAASGGGPPD